MSFSSTAQDQPERKSNTIVSLNSADSVKSDSITYIEEAPLDIAQDRGLNIITPDRKMKMRILGSVRYLVVFDNSDQDDKNDFYTTQIPTGEQSQKIPNYYNGLNQTRLGFEVTRRTNVGDVFVRLEMDFAGSDGFRIRHAYGQFGQFLFGQTWSLFDQISALPATVNMGGPTGSITVRNPQIRYTLKKKLFGMNFATGLEYTTPDLDVPDSILLNAFQLIPDITFRLDKRYDWGSIQFSGVIPVLSARVDNDVVFKAGWGLNASLAYLSWLNGKWYLMGFAGQGMARYIGDLSGNGLDLVVDSAGAVAPVTYGGYVSYEHKWKDNLISNVTYGFVGSEKIDFTPQDTFHWGSTISIDTFWTIVEGARVGAEYIWGNRRDKDKEKGHTSRVNLLFYYDF